MKTMKRALALVLALTMLLALSAVTALAAPTYTITVKNNNSSISMVGNTYTAYKIFDVTYSGEGSDKIFAYTVASGWAKFFTEGAGKDYLKDSNNDAGTLNAITFNGQTKYIDITDVNIDAFAKAALAYATDSSNNIAASGSVNVTEADAKSATINVPTAGYYLVSGTATAPNNQTVVAACSLTTAAPNAEVNVKADVPSIDKKIVEGESKVDANDASIGDSVKYEITSKVPDMKGYTKYFFVIEDTLSKGLTFNNDVEITVNGTKLTENNDYTLTTSTDTDGSTKIKIVFKDFYNKYKDLTGKDIVVTYTATLNQDASLDPVAGNPNKVKLIYSNNPNVDYTGEDEPSGNDPKGETPESVTKTYVTGIKLIKVDGKTQKTLTGAKFEIKGEGVKVVLVNKEIYKTSDTGTYYMLKNGTYTETAPTDDNADSYDSTTQKYEKVTVVTKETVSMPVSTTGYVNAQGELTFEGLGDGTYTITEIVAPDGYNLLKDPITITITSKATLDKCEWTVTDGKGNTLTANTTDHLFELTVENNSGAELPSTGGIGTTIFYVLGGLLVVCAGVLLITKRRMNKEA